MFISASQISEMRAGLKSCGVPFHLHEGIMAYCLQGRPTGSFLAACFANDLMQAVSHADPASLAALKPICQFLYGYAPVPAWGSRERLNQWTAQGGMAGHRET